MIVEKELYRGPVENQFEYRGFRSLMTVAGAEHIRSDNPGANKPSYQIWHLNSATIHFTQFNDSYSHCSVKVFANKSDLSDIEKIILE